MVGVLLLNFDTMKLEFTLNDTGMYRIRTFAILNTFLPNPNGDGLRISDVDRFEAVSLNLSMY
jgi:hypothetical protein